MKTEKTELEKLLEKRSDLRMPNIGLGITAAWGALEVSSYFLGTQSGDHTVFNLILPGAAAILFGHLKHLMVQEDLKDTIRGLHKELQAAKASISSASELRVDEVEEIAQNLSTARPATKPREPGFAV